MEARVSGLLVFDGDCRFCTSSARLAARMVKSAEIVPWQRADLAALGVRRDEAIKAVQWVDGNGRVSAGAEAVARMLLTGTLLTRLLGALLMLPGIRLIADVVYRVVAKNRGRLPGGTPACRVNR
jgi:predicted DCC family thiol-disulfide oxidoreductase YuxK